MCLTCVPVILAGGKGTRIRHLLQDRPKPMAEVYSKPFIVWILDFLAKQGFSQAIISTGYMGGVIQSYFNKFPHKKIHVNCIQEPTPLGTAGGFINAIRHSGVKASSWLVLNGDSLALANLQQFVSQIHGKSYIAGILALYMQDASRYGSLIYNANQYLVEFAEKKPGSGMINAGIYYFDHDALTLFPKHSPLSFETDVFPQLLKNNIPIKIFEANTPFIDIGIPATLKKADSFIKANLTLPSSLI